MTLRSLPDSNDAIAAHTLAPKLTTWQAPRLSRAHAAATLACAAAFERYFQAVENELARLIESGAIAGAGLDVFEHEPAVNPKILGSDRVVALPHMSSATIEGRIDMGEKVIINIKAFLDGHAPPDRVHPAMF